MKLGDFPGLEDGTDVEIWFSRSDKFRDLIVGNHHGSFVELIDPKDLSKSHVCIGRLKSKGVEDADNLYWKLQGEEWSPNGEANQFIRDHAVIGHTSMSVGDVMRFKTGETIVVDCVGFFILEIKK